MAAATTTTISSTLAVVLLYAASLVATGAAGGHHLKANKANDLVVKTCANVTRRHYRGPRLTRQFYEPALRSDKRSMAARDPRDLALMAMDIDGQWASLAWPDMGLCQHGPIANGPTRHTVPPGPCLTGPRA